MTSSRLLYELDQFFWHAEFVEIDEVLPCLQPDVSLWLTLIDSQTSALRQQALARLNAWLLEAARDFNVEVLRQRCREVSSAAGDGVFGRSLDAILKTSEANQSAQTRHLLNAVFLLLQFLEISDFYPSLVRNFHRLTELLGMPMRKFLKIFEKGLSAVQELPESALFPDKSEEKEFPLSHPRLGNFRSFVLLAKHHNSLVSAHPAPPPAIREACGIIESLYGNFFSTYRMHPVEIEYMRNEPSMHEAFVCFARHKTRPSARSKLFEEQEISDSSLFAMNSLLRNATRSPFPQSGRTSDGEIEDDAISVCSDVSVSQDLISQLREISDSDFPSELLRDISVWYDKLRAISDLPATERQDRTERSSLWGQWVKELTGIFLRLKLSACKHSSEYPHFVPVDQDRLLLHAALELKNFGTSELGQISAETELRKNADVIAGTVAGIFLRALEFPGVGDNVVAHNGLLVFLKYANGFEEPDLVGGGSEMVPIMNSLPGSRSFLAAFPSVKITALYRSLQLLWKLVKDHPARVRKFILPFRSVMIMKRLMRCPSYRVQRLVLKLFKVQVRFLPKKMKNMSIKFVSQVFVNSEVTTEPYDDWMLTTSLSVEEDNSNFAVHQGADSVAGETEKQEEQFEVKDDYSGHEEKGSFSVEDLKNVDWRNTVDVLMFCENYKIPRSQVFFGYSSFDEWLHRDVLCSNSQ